MRQDRWMGLVGLEGLRVEPALPSYPRARLSGTAQIVDMDTDVHASKGSCML